MDKNIIEQSTRVTKYRAWDKQNKEMVIVDMILFSTNEIDYKGNNNEPKSIEHFELMQFTGLCNINKKEIYQGDILETKGIDGRQCWVIEYEIDHCSSGFVPRCILDNYSSCHNQVWEEGRVIGNIYKNPELL